MARRTNSIALMGRVRRSAPASDSAMGTACVTMAERERYRIVGRGRAHDRGSQRRCGRGCPKPALRYLPPTNSSWRCPEAPVTQAGQLPHVRIKLCRTRPGLSCTRQPPPSSDYGDTDHRNPNFLRTSTRHVRLIPAANIRKKLGASGVCVIAIRLSIQNGAKPPKSVTPTL